MTKSWILSLIQKSGHPKCTRVCVYMEEETMQNTSMTLKGWYCSVAFASWIILMGFLLNSFGTNSRGTWPKCPLLLLWAKVSITLSPQSTPISFLAVPCAPFPAASLLVPGPLHFVRRSNLLVPALWRYISQLGRQQCQHCPRWGPWQP